MSVAAFNPKFMKVGVLTAALQELTPREKRDPDPDLAIEEWVALPRELGVNYIQLSAAVPPDEADIPPEAMLDPLPTRSICARRLTKTASGACALVWKRIRWAFRMSAISTTCSITILRFGRRSTTL
jgi:hypothetical protein